MHRRKLIGTAIVVMAIAGLGVGVLAVDNTKQDTPQSIKNTIMNISHTGISTTDIERSVHFYRDLMGMELAGEISAFKGDVYDVLFQFKGTYGKVATLRLGGSSIELFEFENPRSKPRQSLRPVFTSGIYHICFQVADVKKEYERLKSAGVSFHSPPWTVEGVAKVTYGRDPDGNVFEMLELIGSGEGKKK